MNSTAKTPVSRRTKAQKRGRIRDYAERNGLTYSAAEERLLDSGLRVEDSSPLGERLPLEVDALFFGRLGDVDKGASAEPGDGSPFATVEELVTHMAASTADRLESPAETLSASPPDLPPVQNKLTK